MRALVLTLLSGTTAIVNTLFVTQVFCDVPMANAFATIAQLATTDRTFITGNMSIDMQYNDTKQIYNEIRYILIL